MPVTRARVRVLARAGAPARVGVPAHGRARVRAASSILLAVLTVTALTLGGCSSSGDEGESAGTLPDGAALVSDAAAEMRTVKSARFTVDAEGTIAGLSLRGAEGQLTREGDAQGSVRLDQGGTLVEIAFVLLGPTAYIKGATGGFQRAPRALAASVYDPSAILDPDRGVARLLATAKEAKTEAKESVGGRDTYRVKAKLSRDALSALVPGVSQDTVGTLWIETAEPRLVRTRIPVGGPDGSAGGTATVTITDVDAPVKITPPAN